METKSIFLTELSEMSEEILREIPKIAKINLTRDFPNTIFAQVVERIPIAIFCDLKKSARIHIMPDPLMSDTGRGARTLGRRC